MGWLLTTKKKRLDAPPRNAPRNISSSEQWNPHRTLRFIQAVSVISLLGVAAFGWTYLEDCLSRYAAPHAPGMSQAPPASSDSADQLVELSPLPSWISPLLHHQLCQEVADQLGTEVFTNDGLARAVEALINDPWVERVAYVRRTDQGRVIVRADYRQPVAVVRAATGYHLVDAKGVRLPGRYEKDQLRQLDLPLIVGLSQPPQPEGTIWPGQDLQAGLALSQLLADQPYWDQIEAFDVSGRDARGRIDLVLHTRGGRVHWGLPPGEERAIEPESAVKMRRLYDVYAQRGAIDAGDKIVDINGAAVFIHQPALQPVSFNQGTLSTPRAGVGAWAR